MYGKGSIRSFFDYSSFSRSIEKAKVGSGGGGQGNIWANVDIRRWPSTPLHSAPLPYNSGSLFHSLEAELATEASPSAHVYEGEASNQWGYCRRPNNQSVWPGNICRGFLFSLLQDVCNM